MRDAFIERLHNLIRQDSQTILLTADLGFGAFERISKENPKNFLNVGVAEQNMMGVAAGLALEGHTVFTYSIANFATLRCLEQIRNDACYHDANINIVSNGGGFGYGPLGMSHHATEDLSILRALPNVTVVVPCDAWEAEEATEVLSNTPGVGYLRINKVGIDLSQKAGEKFILGKARCLREGKSVTLISAGSILSEVLLAADMLAKEGIECRVLSMHTIKPIDKEAILVCAQETGGIITIEENNILGGLGGAVAEICLEGSLRPKKFKRIGLNDLYSSIVGSQSFLRKYYQMDSSAIVEAIKELFL